jgi:hypothetical protein
LSGALTVRANRRFFTAGPEAALEDMQEAVRLRRERFAAEPIRKRRGELAATLSDLGGILHGHEQEALEVTNEALAICRELEAEVPGSYVQTISEYTANKATILFYDGKGHAADALLRNSMRSLEQGLRDDRDTFLGPYALLLAVRARLLAASGDYAQAERTAARVIDLYRGVTKTRVPITSITVHVAHLALGHALLRTRRVESGTKILMREMEAVRDLGDPILMREMEAVRDLGDPALTQYVQEIMEDVEAPLHELARQAGPVPAVWRVAPGVSVAIQTVPLSEARRMQREQRSAPEGDRSEADS